MFSDKYLIQLQDSVGYRFNDVYLLEKSLTTAGAEGDKESEDSQERDRYDGNRKLANVGDKLLQLVVMIDVFSRGNQQRRRDASAAIAANKDILVARAKKFEIDKHLKLNPRLQGRPTKTTLSTAVNAIIGAAWQDSLEDMKTARGVIEHFGQVLIPFIVFSYPKARHHQEEVFINEVTQDIFHDLRGCSNNDDALHSSSDALEILSFADELPSSPLHAACPEISSRETGKGPVHGQIRDYSMHDREGEVGNRNMTLETSRNTDSRIVASSLLRRPDNTRQNGPKDLQSQSKKRKAQQKTLRIHTSRTEFVKDYIQSEQERCRALALPMPKRDLGSALKAHGMNVGDNGLAKLNTLYLGIASPESFATLHDLVNVQRRPVTGKPSIPCWNLPLKERVEAIEGLNDDIMYKSFLKRCHILELFTSLSGSHKTSDGFINETNQTLSGDPRSQLGNPLVMEDSKVSKEMLAQLYPGLDRNSPEYSRKERFVNKLRKTGQRLDLLVQKFGFGIIGLVPLPSDGGELAFNITDTM
ncbi:RNase III [Glarea lozoyensis ATCC 20868]|uniref:RNase III n=1 Tax=Glarea lozoyensis (strain ATCC 20868 / MF5171) TaxID=1116229 RepID=S3D977_GLAL2|nr:RNase III [Glarea lozoyensis ATCC 20868]EPE34260.1 RNase III [Glarea lozoyensis ATCC 20868]